MAQTITPLIPRGRREGGGGGEGPFDGLPHWC